MDACQAMLASVCWAIVKSSAARLSPLSGRPGRSGVALWEKRRLARTVRSPARAASEPRVMAIPSIWRIGWRPGSMPNASNLRTRRTGARDGDGIHANKPLLPSTPQRFRLGRLVSLASGLSASACCAASSAGTGAGAAAACCASESLVQPMRLETAVPNAALRARAASASSFVRTGSFALNTRTATIRPSPPTSLALSSASATGCAPSTT